MSALAINFVAPARRRMSLFGLTLLAAGGACLVLVTLDLEQREQQLASSEARLKSLTRGLALRGQTSAPTLSNTAKTSAAGPAAKILPRLQAPWHELLGELESAADGPIALLGVDADARSRNLRLAGEAKSIDEVLAFVERLRASHRLDDVYLLSHEPRTIGAATVIAFTVSALWPDGERKPGDTQPPAARAVQADASNAGKHPETPAGTPSAASDGEAPTARAAGR
jgi:hypothetical protein